MYITAASGTKNLNHEPIFVTEIRHEVSVR